MTMTSSLPEQAIRKRHDRNGLGGVQVEDQEEGGDEEEP